jgi:hypothetical protein
MHKFLVSVSIHLHIVADIQIQHCLHMQHIRYRTCNARHISAAYSSVFHAYYYHYCYSHVDTLFKLQQIVQYVVQVTVNLLVISVLSVFVVAEVQL